jgi:hypothetical protein
MQRCPQYRRWTPVLVLWVLTLSWVGQPLTASAQPQLPERMGDRQKHFEMLRMWRLVEELEIDEAQAMKVFPAFRRHRVLQDSLKQRHRRLLSVVTSQLEEQVDDETLQVSIRNVQQATEAIDRAETAFEEDLAKLLTTRQQARLLLFDSSFRMDLVDIVRRMRGGGGPTGEGPGRVGGRGPRWEE